MTTEKTAEKETLTVGEQIWNGIKNKDLPLFSLPGQKVSDYCQPVPIDPSRCFLVYKASAVIPMLEELIGKDLQLEVAEKYIIISKKQYAF